MRRVLCELLFAGMACELAGCAYTDVTSFTDPAYQGASYDNVVVMVRFGDLKYNQIAEQQFIRVLSRYKLRVAGSMSLFPPTREISKDDMAAKLKEHGARALLLVTLQGYWTDTYTTPGYASTTGFGTIHGGMVQYNQTTTYTPGTPYTKPRAQFDVKLVDVTDDSVAWMSSTSSRGNAFADMETLSLSLAYETTGRLMKQGLIRDCRR